MPLLLKLNTAQAEVFVEAVLLSSELARLRFGYLKDRLVEMYPPTHDHSDLNKLFSDLTEALQLVDDLDYKLSPNVLSAFEILTRAPESSSDDIHTFTVPDEKALIGCMNACEQYARYGMFQFDSLYSNSIAYACQENEELTKDMQKKARAIVYDFCSQYNRHEIGISFTHSEKNQISWDLYQVLRQEQGNNYFNRQAMAVSNHPLPVAMTEA